MPDVNMEAVSVEQGNSTLYEVLYFAPPLPMVEKDFDKMRWSVVSTDIENYDAAVALALNTAAVYRVVKIHRITREYEMTRVWITE